MIECYMSRGKAASARAEEREEAPGGNLRFARDHQDVHAPTSLRVMAAFSVPKEATDHNTSEGRIRGIRAKDQFPTGFPHRERAGQLQRGNPKFDTVQASVRARPSSSQRSTPRQ